MSVAPPPPCTHRWTRLGVLLLIAAGTQLRADADADVDFAPVQVTAPGLLSTPSRLNTEDIEAGAAPTSDTAHLLQQLPGVRVLPMGQVSGLPSIHGFADDRLRIQVDGMDWLAACANHMNPPLSLVSPQQVESIEVFAGITPASVGGDSLGGTIRVETKAPTFAPAGEPTRWDGALGGFYRTASHANGVHLEVGAASHRWSLGYNGAFEQAANYRAAQGFKPAGLAAPGRDWIDADEVGSTRFETQNHRLRLATGDDQQLLQLQLGVQHMPYQGYPNQRMDLYDNDSVQTSARYERFFGWGELRGQLFHEHTEHKMNFGDDKQFWYGPTADIPGMPMQTDAETLGARIEGEVATSAKDTLIVGTELHRHRLDDWWPASGGMMMGPNEFINIHNGERDRFGAFIDWERRWNSAWSSMMGLRYEQVSMDAGSVQGYGSAAYTADAAAFNAADRERIDHNLDLSVLLQWVAGDQWTLAIGGAQKTRSPNLHQRYTWSRTSMVMLMNNLLGDGNGYVGNLNLEPEIARTLSIRVDWHDPEGRWQLQAAPYITDVKDYIDAARCTGTGTGMMTRCGGTANATATNSFVFLEYTNVHARLYGLDLSGRLTLSESTSTRTDVQVGLNYVEGENRDTDDGLYNTPPAEFKLSLIRSLGPWTLSAETAVVAPKTDVSVERNEIETAGYALTHLRASWIGRTSQIDFGVENLFDRAHADPLGGAYVGQGTTMSATGTPWGIAVPGTERSVYVSLRYRF